MLYQKMEMGSVRLVLMLTLLFLTGNVPGVFAQENGFERSTSPGSGVVGSYVAQSVPYAAQTAPMEGSAWAQQQPEQQPQTAPQPMYPAPQSEPGMPVGLTSPIDGYWFCMTPQGPIMMGLQNGTFMMMGANGQIFGQGTFVIQGQQIVSTLANGQQEIFDFQCDGANLQLRDSKTGAVIAYQKVQNQPGSYVQPGYTQPSYPGQPQQYPQMPQQYPQTPQQYPQMPQQYPQQMPQQYPQQMPQQYPQQMPQQYPQQMQQQHPQQMQQPYPQMQQMPQMPQ